MTAREQRSGLAAQIEVKATYGTGSSLMTASYLVPPLWLPVTNPVQNTGTVFSTILTGSASYPRFYRLQSN